MSSSWKQDATPMPLPVGGPLNNETRAALHAGCTIMFIKRHKPEPVSCLRYTCSGGMQGRNALVADASDSSTGHYCPNERR